MTPLVLLAGKKTVRSNEVCTMRGWDMHDGMDVKRYVILNNEFGIRIHVKYVDFHEYTYFCEYKIAIQWRYNIYKV